MNPYLFYCTLFNRKIEIKIYFKKIKICNIICKQNYLSSSVRHNHNNFNILTKKYLSFYNKINSKNITFINMLNFNTDGIYIETNIDNIKSISAKCISIDNKILNNNLFLLLDYDKLKINLFGKKINKNLIFLPFNCIKLNSIMNTNIIKQQYINTKFIINVDFQNEESYLNFHFNSYNIGIYNDGMFCNKFYDDIDAIELLFSNFEFDNKKFEKTIYVTSYYDLDNLSLNLEKIAIPKKMCNTKIKIPYGCKYKELL